MNILIDKYLEQGCMRCPLGATAACKVHNWPEELVLMRKIILDCGLNEELKWSMPCYTYQNANILMLAAFKEYCSISFFKGALLADTEKVLYKQGEESQHARLFKFTNVEEIRNLMPTIKAYIYEAIEIEKLGLKVEKKTDIVLCDELQNILNEQPQLKTAFEALTPGRQRGYNIYFSAPKQSKTRVDRIEKYIPDILIGKGFYD